MLATSKIIVWPSTTSKSLTVKQTLKLKQLNKESKFAVMIKQQMKTLHFKQQPTTKTEFQFNFPWKNYSSRKVPYQMAKSNDRTQKVSYS